MLLGNFLLRLARSTRISRLRVLLLITGLALLLIAGVSAQSVFWSPLGFGMSQNFSGGSAIATFGSNVYAGGGQNGFFICGNADCTSGGTRSNQITMWDGASWSMVGNGLNGDVYALAVNDNGSLYAGGTFQQICGNKTCDSGNIPTNAVAMWDGTKWSPLGFGLQTSAPVPLSALAVIGNNLYAGGDIVGICTNATCDNGNFTTANRVAMWNGSKWSPVGFGLVDQVNALAASGSDLYAGGELTGVCGNAKCDSGNTRANHVAIWNGISWSPVGNGLDGPVYSVAVSGSNLYAAGAFTNICGNATCDSGNIPANHVAKWDGSTWSPLGNGLGGKCQGSGFTCLEHTFTLAASGPNVYVGGPLIEICGNATCDSGNTVTNYIAKWNGSSWSPLNFGVNNPVSALTMSGSNLYVLGYFNNICGNATCDSGNVRANSVAVVTENFPAQLEMTKTVNPSQVTVGQNLTYTITVKNKGPDAAQAVTVTDPLANNVSFSSANSTQGNCSNSNGTVICNIGTLANAATATVTIVATANAPGDVPNTATVSGANSQSVQASVHATASACTFTLASPSVTVPASSGTDSVSFTASASNCAWTAISNASWITITSAASGTGNGTVNYSVAANTGSSRTGTLTIAGQIFTVTQAAPLQLLLDESGPATDQAAALDSVLFTRDPFPVVNGADLVNMGSDRNTRVIVFVMNLQLAQGETSSSVVVSLIDSNNQSYDITAEDVRPVTNFPFTQVVFRLPNNISIGTCIITIKAHGQTSNSGSIRIRT